MVGSRMSRYDPHLPQVRVISLARAPGEREAWDRPKLVVYGWAICELVFVTNPWQISSKLRVSILRAFGANIGTGVTFRPRTRVKFPWKLTIGNDVWIGEGVWFHNQDRISVGNDVVISQETMLTTGSHAHRKDMALITSPIQIKDGAWITSRCMILGGVTIGISAVVAPMTVVDVDVPDNTIVRTSSSFSAVGTRFNNARSNRDV
jgi:putative colanic acid biosynthesis acetyltransferase WcaF